MLGNNATSLCQFLYLIWCFSVHLFLFHKDSLCTVITRCCEDLSEVLFFKWAKANPFCTLWFFLSINIPQAFCFICRCTASTALKHLNGLDLLHTHNYLRRLILVPARELKTEVMNQLLQNMCIHQDINK